MRRHLAGAFRRMAEAVQPSPGLELQLTNPWHALEVLRTRFGAAERHLLGAGLLADADLDLRVVRGEVTYFLQPSMDAIVNEIVETGSYSEHELTQVITWMRARHRQGVVLNVGANVGTTALRFATEGWPVVAVEPAPPALRLLRENVAANGVDDRVTIVEAAVAREECQVEMAVGSNLSTSELTLGRDVSLLATTGDYQVRTTLVRALPVERILQEAQIGVDQVALVWSDTEGSEADVISGGRKLWDSGVPLWVEVRPTALAARQPLSAFCQLVADSFSGFLSDTELADGVTRFRPIASFPEYLTGLGSGRWDFGNVLLSRDASSTSTGG